MLILSPVDGASEVPGLVEAGADELYAGFVPPFWSELFGPVVSCNRRSYAEANVPTLDELSDLVRAAAVRDVPVHLALNATPVPDAIIPDMVAFAAGLARTGIRGVIVSDLPLLVALRDARFRRLEIHASTLFSAFNGAAVAFLRRAGATRVILAREVTVAEASAAVAAAPGTPIEVIGLRGRCPNIEGFCTHLHDDPGRTWPCELRYDKEWRGQGPFPDGVRDAIARNEGTDRANSCGLCAIPLLDRAGVHAFKIVGRGAESERKVAAVAAANAMREFGRAGSPDAAACARRGKAMYREIFGSDCRPENCYFPEFGPGEPHPPRDGTR